MKSQVVSLGVGCEERTQQEYIFFSILLIICNCNNNSNFGLWRESIHLYDSSLVVRMVQL